MILPADAACLPDVETNSRLMSFDHGVRTPINTAKSHWYSHLHLEGRYRYLIPTLVAWNGRHSPMPNLRFGHYRAE